jgi:hypothetical protein
MEEVTSEQTGLTAVPVPVVKRMELRQDAEGRLVIPNDINCIREDGVPLEPMIKMFSRVIDCPPVPNSAALYKQACANDDITVLSWMPQWKKKSADNRAKYDFSTMSASEDMHKQKGKPVVLAGSGPSLKRNAKHLKNKGDICVVSCLHNFGMFEDLGVMGPNDYYLTLDAGEITIPEMLEAGKKYTEEEYWARTKDRTLICSIYSPTILLDKWQGRKLFFFAPTPNDELKKHISGLLDFNKVPCFQVGGNALGACFYYARAILGAGPVIFIGADFSFDYAHKFHPWENTYQFAGVVPCVDIYGNRVFSWQSYVNFAAWLTFQAMGGQGGNNHIMINATEGGILGAYPDGNIKQIIQMDLRTALWTFNMTDTMPKMLSEQKEREMLLF